MTEGQSEAIRAQVYAFYTLCALLEAKGILEPGEIGGNLRRLRIPDDANLSATLDAMANNLEDNPFGPRGTLRLLVVDGGKDTTA